MAPLVCARGGERVFVITGLRLNPTLAIGAGGAMKINH
jgi:hypothetical protein